MICPKCGEDIDPVEEVTSEISVDRDTNGRMKMWIEELKDFNGILVEKRINVYDYYETGETKNILMKRFDGKNKLVSEKNIKHFIHGEKPEITEIKKEAQNVFYNN